MITQIKNLIQKNYKRANIENVSLFDDDCLVIKSNGCGKKEPFIALRILRKYDKIRSVHFTGGWVEGFYSRATLRWAGYKI